MTRSSGYPHLDAETCKLMVAHGKFKSIKDEDGRLVTKRRCVTAREWDLGDDYARAEVKRMEDSVPGMVR